MVRSRREQLDIMRRTVANQVIRSLVGKTSGLTLRQQASSAGVLGLSKGVEMYKSGKRQTSKKAGGYKRVARGGDIVRKNKRQGKKKSKSLKARVKALEIDKHTAVYHWRNYSLSQSAHLVNECAYKDVVAWDPATIENAIDSLPFLDRAVTPAIQNINLKALARNHQVLLRNLYAELTIRNNGLMPLNCVVYKFSCVNSTNNSPKATLTSGGTDIGLTASPEINMLAYPSDFPIVKQHWKMEGSTTYQLNAGDTVKDYITMKRLKYDPEVYDQESSPTYMKGHTMMFLVRTSGVPCHGQATATNLAFSDGFIDLCVKQKIDVHYPSDANFKTIATAINGETTLTDAVVGGPNVVLVSEDS